jgi:O-antigen ligase
VHCSLRDVVFPPFAFFEKDLISWIGLLVVVQNFVSSILNAHLFDFQEGWIYVIGVATAGGIKLPGRWLPHEGASDPRRIQSAA